MALPKPGEFITAKCSRCNDVTGHVIMLVIGGEITKVECKACGSVHKYRSVKVPKSTGSSSSSVRHVRAGQGRESAVSLGGASPKPVGVKAAKAHAAKIESAWQESMVRHSHETPVLYSASVPLAKGMFIEHEVFGRGEVITVIKPNKVEILFQDGVKLLRGTLA